MEVTAPLASNAYPLFGWVIALGFTLTTLYQIRNLIHGRASTSWGRVKAQVTKVEIRIDRDPDRVDTYVPVLAYRYRVKGRWYECERFTFTGFYHRSRKAAAGEVRGLVVGSEITVRVHPTTPRLAVYKPGAQVSDYLALGVLLAVSAYVLSEVMSG